MKFVWTKIIFKRVIFYQYTMARRDKHFPESKAHPRIHKHLTQKHAQTPKHMSCLLGEVLFCRLKVVLKIVDTNITS